MRGHKGQALGGRNHYYHYLVLPIKIMFAIVIVNIMIIPHIIIIVSTRARDGGEIILCRNSQGHGNHVGRSYHRVPAEWKRGSHSYSYSYT